MQTINDGPSRFRAADAIAIVALLSAQTLSAQALSARSSP